MAERSGPARARPVGPVPERDDALASLNDHLGRFLRQADDLLDEWARFSSEVRARVDGSVAQLGDTVAEAVDASVDRVAARVESEVGARLAARISSVTDDLDRVARAARAAGTAASALQLDRRRTSRLAAAALAAALLSNLLLGVVLILLLTRAPSGTPAPAVREPDAPVQPAATPAQVPDAGSLAPVPDAQVHGTEVHGTEVHGTEVHGTDAGVDAGPVKREGSKAPPKRKKR